MLTAGKVLEHLNEAVSTLNQPKVQAPPDMLRAQIVSPDLLG